MRPQRVMEMTEAGRGCSRYAIESVPQRLKPQGKCGVYGMAEAVPLTKSLSYALGVCSFASF